MSQVGDIVNTIQTAIVAKTTARSGAGAFKAAKMEGAIDETVHPPGEREFYVKPRAPQPSGELSNNRQWMKTRIDVLLGQETQGDDEDERAIAVTNIARVKSAVENASGYPSGFQIISMVEAEIDDGNPVALVSRLSFEAIYDEAYT